MPSRPNFSRLLLHAGPQKTGSTYLQGNFTAHRAALQGLGVHYAHRLDATRPAHTLRSELASWLPQADDAALATLGGARSPDGVTLVSDEALSQLSAADTARLLRVLCDAAAGPVEAVFVFRRWSGRLVSTWAQRLREGSGQTFEAWLQETRERRAQPYSDVALWERWAQGLRPMGGRQALHILAYDPIMASGADMFPLFLQRLCGVPADAAAALPPGPNLNTSPPDLALEALRGLNAAAAAAGQSVALDDRRRWLRRLEGRGFEPFASFLPRFGRDLVLDDMDDALAEQRDALPAWQDRVVPLADDAPPPAMLLPGTRVVRVFDPAWMELPRGRGLLARALETIATWQARRAAARAQAGADPGGAADDGEDAAPDTADGPEDLAEDAAADLG